MHLSVYLLNNLLIDLANHLAKYVFILIEFQEGGTPEAATASSLASAEWPWVFKPKGKPSLAMLRPTHLHNGHGCMKGDHLLVKGIVRYFGQRHCQVTTN